MLRFPPAALGAPTSSLSFSRDGKRLAVGLHQIAMSLGLMVLDVVSGRALATARASVDDVAFSPDGRSVVDAEIALTSGGSIVLRDAATLAPRRTLTRMPDVEATAAAFSPDRADVAFGGADGTAGLTSVGGQRVASYLGQTAAINRVAFARTAGSSPPRRVTARRASGERQPRSCRRTPSARARAGRRAARAPDRGAGR